MKPAVLSSLFFLFILVVSIVDIALDFLAPKLMNYHVWFELFTAIVALTGLGTLISYIHRQNLKMQKLKQELSITKDTLRQTKQTSAKLTGDLSRFIQSQFDEWLLTPSEKEIALLLLKGLTLEEVASVRDTKEKTVRQHASHLYKKAGISGRHELVAYFFEDFLN
jgi:DNA-binding CsgD family transcriptional regulator